jgi:hypothetical protein
MITAEFENATSIELVNAIAMFNRRKAMSNNDDHLGTS